jgi:hypothetical protein
MTSLTIGAAASLSISNVTLTATTISLYAGGLISVPDGTVKFSSITFTIGYPSGGGSLSGPGTMILTGTTNILNDNGFTETVPVWNYNFVMQNYISVNNTGTMVFSVPGE